MISFAVTAKLICVFVFAYADCWFSHKTADLSGEILTTAYRYLLLSLVNFTVIFSAFWERYQYRLNWGKQINSNLPSVGKVNKI